MSNRRAFTRDEIACVSDSKELKDMQQQADDAVEGIETLLDFSPETHPRRTAAVTALIHWKRAKRDIESRLHVL
jgi:hypothetical protein